MRAFALLFAVASDFAAEAFEPLPCKRSETDATDVDCSINASLSALTSADFMIKELNGTAMEWSSLRSLSFDLDVRSQTEQLQIEKPSIAAMVSMGRSFSEIHDKTPPLQERLLCMIPKETSAIFTVRSSEDAQITLSAKVQKIELNQMNVPTQITLKPKRNKLVFFELDDSERVQFHIKGNRSEVQKQDRVRVFIFPVDPDNKTRGNCLQRQLNETEGHEGSCVSSMALGTCLLNSMSSALNPEDNQHPESVSFSVNTQGAATISRWSVLPPKKGIWVVLLQGSNAAESNYIVEARVANQWPLWLAAMVMVLLPCIVVGFLTATSAVFTRQWRARTFNSPAELDRLWQMPGQLARECGVAVSCSCIPGIDDDFKNFLRQKFRGITKKQNESYLALVLVGAGSFFIVALQIAIGMWGTMMNSGNLDQCYYNFDCYIPFFFDVPFNNIVSHIPYIVCGILVIAAVLHAEYQILHQILRDQVGIACPDFRVFYALGLAICMEAVGSSCYHLCPKSFQFQFDTAMMFVIALLSTLALVADNNSQRTDDVASPVALLLILVLPMWLTSFVGTWFDFLLPNPSDMVPLQVLYILVNLVWGAVICVQSRRLFPGDSAPWCGQKRGLLVLRVVLVVILLVALFGDFLLPNLRRNSGGMSNILLALSILAMAIVCVRQVWRHDVWPGQCYLAGIIMKFGLFAGFVVVAAVAIYFFLKNTTDVLTDPAISRTHNRECVFLIFDDHDMWHLLSAIALALWVLVLLEVHTRIWKRRLPEPPRTPTEGPITWSTGSQPSAQLITFHVPVSSNPATAPLILGQVAAPAAARRGAATFQNGSTS